MIYSASFSSCFEALIGNEGGYVNNPNDPGGETSWGISKRAYPHLNIRSLTKDGAMDIYYRDFWLVAHCENFHHALAFEVFDAAVNHGITKSIMLLQQAAGVADDGHFGPITRKAVDATPLNDLLLRFQAYRLKFYIKLSKWDSFGRGWVDRVANNLIRDSNTN
jgi:lysozyme family protein